ncbi:N-acetylmuramoyl-L-alanine amidase family protein [Tunturiibacter gelidoferens]|uniref:N-acetylmuramoyl-L-alanine amidase n=1 Tax=Tunturiibacter gelidiferens TaxID=3069689 RepID=A0AAU7YZ10_9BACT
MATAFNCSEPIHAAVSVKTPYFAFLSPLHPTLYNHPDTLLTHPCKQFAPRLFLVLLTSLAPITAQAQQPIPRTTIFLDPAHGGADSGARLSDSLPEKSLTLTFAARLRALLSTSGFSVIATRDSDPSVPFTTDQRAEIANHSHPTACLVLHATASGNGIHIITSDVPPPDDDDTDTHHAIPWDTAQSASIPQSLALANSLGLALLHSRLPVLLTRSSLRPLDNLTCPAVAIEIAPLVPADGEATPVSDANYQQQIAQAIATGLANWRRNQNPAAGAAR